MRRIVFINEKNRARYLKLIAPLERFLAATGIHPNVLSVIGLLLSLLAGLIYSNGDFFWAAWVVVIAGVFDTLDGQIARITLRANAFGAFFDSTLDRYGEMFLFLGLAYHFAGGEGLIPAARPGGGGGESSPLTVAVIILAMAGSFMVSYARARAEGLGLECREGLMQRPERITLLVIGSLLGSVPGVGPLLLKGVLLILAVSANLTALQRMIQVWRKCREDKG